VIGTAGSLDVIAFFRRKRPTTSTSHGASTAAERQERPRVVRFADSAPALHRRVEQSVAGQEPRLMLESIALAEGSAAIDAVRDNLAAVWQPA
jgi:hypothetical protein